MPHLIPNWREVLRHAWSVRLALAAALLSGAEFTIPFLYGGRPSGWFAAAAMLVSVAAFLARLVAQRRLSGGAP